MDVLQESKEGFNAVLYIIDHVKSIRDSGINRKENYQYSVAYKELRTKLSLLKSRFKENTRYAFIVKEKQHGTRWGRVVDQYGMEHPVNMSSRYDVDDYITCNVFGYYAKVKEPNLVVVNLKLDAPRKLSSKLTPDEYVPEEAPHFIKSPDKWYGEVIDLGKHKCGKPFTCSCCGKDFSANQGVRVDFKEIYFCNTCKRLIYEPSGRGWAGRIISTPMGNKR